MTSSGHWGEAPQPQSAFQALEVEIALSPVPSPSPLHSGSPLTPSRQAGRWRCEDQLALETPRGETQNHCFSGSRPAPARLCPLPVVPRGRMDHAPGQRRGRLPARSIPPSCIPASLWPACKNPPVLSVGVREGPDSRYRRVDKGCRTPLGSQGLKPWKVVQPQPSTLNQPPPVPSRNLPLLWGGFWLRSRRTLIW